MQKIDPKKIWSRGSVSEPLVGCFPPTFNLQNDLTTQFDPWITLCQGLG